MNDVLTRVLREIWFSIRLDLINSVNMAAANAATIESNINSKFEV